MGRDGKLKGLVGAAMVLAVVAVPASALGEVVTPHAVRPTVVTPQPAAPQVVAPTETAPAPAESAPEPNYDPGAAVSEPTESSPAEAGAEPEQARRHDRPSGFGVICERGGCTEPNPPPPAIEPEFELRPIREIFIGRLLCPWYFAGWGRSLDGLGQALESNPDGLDIEQGVFDAIDSFSAAMRHTCLHLREP